MMTRSAWATTVLETVVVLLPALGSGVALSPVLATLAVLLAVEPLAVLEFTRAVMMNVCVAPGANGPVAVKVVVLPVVDGVNVPAPMSVEDWNDSLADSV